MVEHNGKPKIKVSNNPEKTTNPGIKKVLRFYDAGDFMEADALAGGFEDPAGAADEVLIIDPFNPLRRKRVQVKRLMELHEDVVTGGEVVYRFPRLEEIRQRRGHDLAHLHESYRRLRNAHEYKVGLTSALWEKKEQLLQECMLPAGSEDD